MGHRVRFSICLDDALLKQFDAYCAHKSCPTRSKAIADLMYTTLTAHKQTHHGRCAGTIVLVYDHHKRHLLNKLASIQHDFHHLIISTQHIHLDHHNCLEIVVVKGMLHTLETLAQTLRSVKGVACSTLNIATVNTL